MKGKVKYLVGAAVIALAGAAVFANTSILAMSETARTDYAIMDGVTESTVYLVDSGRKNIRAHVLKVDAGAKLPLAGMEGLPPGEAGATRVYLQGRFRGMAVRQGDELVWRMQIPAEDA